jgi:hypothetical protein
MRVLLEHDNGSTEELKADILPADAKVILIRTGILLMQAEMDRLSNILTEQIGVGYYYCLHT